MSYHMVSRGVKGYHPNMDRITFGEWLKAMRRSHNNMTQQQLADQAGVHRSYIVKIETGKVMLPEEETRQKFHQIFKTSDDDLRHLGVIEELDIWGRRLQPQRATEGPRSTVPNVGIPDSSLERGELIEAIIHELRITNASESTLLGIWQILSGAAFKK